MLSRFSRNRSLPPSLGTEQLNQKPKRPFSDPPTLAPLAGSLNTGHLSTPPKRKKKSPHLQLPPRDSSEAGSLTEDAQIRQDVQEAIAEYCDKPECTRATFIDEETGQALFRGSAICVTNASFMAWNEDAIATIETAFLRTFPRYPILYIGSSDNENGLLNLDLSFEDPVAATKIMHALSLPKSVAKKSLRLLDLGSKAKFEEAKLCPCESYIDRLDRTVYDIARA